jgi:DNA repair protein RadC
MFELKIVRERRAGYGPLCALRSAAEIWLTFKHHFDAADREQFILLLLNTKNIPIGFHVVSVGSLTASIVHPREVCKAIVLANAAGVVLMHNHPSGIPTPSTEDIAITRRLREIGDLLGVRVLDHIIFGDERFVSFVDDGTGDRS